MPSQNSAVAAGDEQLQQMELLGAIGFSGEVRHALHLLPSGEIIFPLGAGVCIRQGMVGRVEQTAEGKIETELQHDLLRTGASAARSTGSSSSINNSISNGSKNSNNNSNNNGSNNSNNNKHNESLRTKSNLSGTSHEKHRTEARSREVTGRPRRGSDKSSKTDSSLSHVQDSLDSEYLAQGLQRRTQQRGCGVVGVRQLEELYRSMPSVNFDAIAKATRSVSTRVGVGSSSSVESLPPVQDKSHQKSTNGSEDLSGGTKHQEPVGGGGRRSSTNEVIGYQHSIGNDVQTGNIDSFRKESPSYNQDGSGGRFTQKAHNHFLRRHEILSGHKSRVTALAVSADGSIIVSAEEGQPAGQGLVCVWRRDVTGWALVGHHRGHPEGYLNLKS
ncbi:nuclear transcription factor Y subunit alpha-like, partial [Hyalella azteca]|uniref:Nuclear transcription factor Y subunit alpha-like n=1 Tax=Hyalella azteca TaxID=294128 RepID=A0A979FJ21_HYAAZ